MALSRGNDVVCAGPGEAVLGNPLLSLHWLAGALGAQGDSFRAGDRVLSGAVAAAVVLTPAATWTVRADGFGEAALHTYSTENASK